MSARQSANPALLRELPETDANRIRDVLALDAKNRAAFAAKREAMLHDASDEARRILRDLGGKADWRGLYRALRDQRRDLRARLQPPAGLKLSRADLDTARRKAGDGILRDHGVDPGLFAKANAGLDAAVQKASEQVYGAVTPGYHTASNLDAWMKLSPLHAHALPWGVAPPLADPADPAAFQLFGTADFFEWPGHFEAVESDGFNVTLPVQEMIASWGYVGQEVRMSLGDADSFDLASAVADTRLAFIYTAPADGHVEVIVDAIITTNSHDLSTEDEWGWSETWTHQTNSIAVQVLGHDALEPMLSPMSRLDSSDISTTIHRENLIPGDHYYGHGVTGGRVRAGDFNVILVGTNEFDICRCNDTGYSSETAFHWLIRGVEVRIRP